MPRSFSRRRVLAALPAALACALGAGAARPLRALGAGGEPIRIGVSGPFTGGSSPMGISMREGIRIAAGLINARGGVLGRELELVERDDQADNKRGARIAEELVHKEGIVAALGIVNTGVALASQRHYQLARIPMITAVATGSLITRQFLPPEFADNYIFRVSANDSLQAQVIVDEAVTRRGLQRLAIFHDATNYGVLGSEDLTTALHQRGLAAVIIERFQLRETDMGPALRRARQAGAEAVLTYGIGPELAQIANDLARLNWRVPIIGSWTLAMSSFIDRAGPNAEGARMPQTFIRRPPTPHVAPSWRRGSRPPAWRASRCRRRPRRGMIRCSCWHKPSARPTAWKAATSAKRWRIYARPSRESS